jgi:Abnormal spindle-like microcephaly-assoc'd, ASPM-SPD-2-Hydin
MNGAQVRFGVFVLAGLFAGMAGRVERAAAGGKVPGAQQAAAQESTQGAAEQAIQVVPDSVTFVNVPVGELYTQTVRISNLSTGKLSITQIASSAGEFAITGITLPVELEPGANVNFNVAYKPKVMRNVAGRILVTTGRNTTPAEIAVKASTQSKAFGFSVNASSLDFGVVPVGNKATKEFELENGGNTAVTVSKITVSGENFSVASGNGIKLAPGQKTVVQVAFNPLKAGNREGVVTVVSSSPDSPMEIPLSGSAGVMSARSVELKWEESMTTVAGYNVYRSNEADGSYTKLEPRPVTTASYTDTGLAAGHTYYYLIRAVDANEAESDDSEQISVTVPEG